MPPMQHRLGEVVQAHVVNAVWADQILHLMNSRSRSRFLGSGSDEALFSEEKGFFSEKVQGSSPEIKEAPRIVLIFGVRSEDIQGIFCPR